MVWLGSWPVVREEPYLTWVGILAVVLGMIALVLVANLPGQLSIGVQSAAGAAGPLAESSSALASRTSCAEIGSSDLRSPSEGVWFQDNCLSVPGAPLLAPDTSCNRTSLDPAEFREI